MNKKNLSRKKILRGKKTLRGKRTYRKKTKGRKKTMKQRKKKSKSLKSRYTSIANKIDKVIDSHFKSKSKKKSGTKKGPFSKKNPRVELIKMEKEASKKLINEGNKLDYDASKLTGIAANFLEEKIINDMNESIRVLNESSQSNMKENKKKFIEKSLLFWKMCENYSKTKICVGKNATEKIQEYGRLLDQIN
jgi:hypothetical protein